MKNSILRSAPRKVSTCLLVGLTALNAAFGESIETLCVVRELDEIEVPAKRDGLIATLLVRRGMRVEANERLAELDQLDITLRLNVARAELQQAEARADNDGPVAASESAVSRAQKESRLLAELGDNAVYLERFRMENNLERSLAELRTSQNQLLQDRLQVEVKRNEMYFLENDLKQTVVHSPVRGVVRQLIRQQGEWVRQGEPILVVTRMDRLLVEGFVDAKTIPPHKVTGATAQVSIEVANGQPTKFDGLVVAQAAPKLELDGKFPVWVEINNELTPDRRGTERWLIRPGMTGSIVVHIE